ncbi:MAG: KpsF/GutQ family sugar-phosphate isomerase [Nitrospirae bacterium]|nr:KpsF/GutQ family sugar-phosphate isomerase [Nitrospirota bacterium]
MLDHAKKVLRIEAEAIAALIDKVDGSFAQAVGLILACKGRVVVTGMGKSGLIGKKIAATLASTGTPALFLHPAEGIHGDLGMVTKGDVIIAISNSGETEEIIKLLPVFKRLAVPVIAMTGGINSTLAKAAEATIDVGVKEEACPMGLVPTASTTAALAMGDAIAITLLDERGFKEEDFACFHPGGSLGKRILLRVEDVMHAGALVPVVKETTGMREALFEITSKKLGLTTVVDGSGKLLGVITDGDLRRYLEKSGDIFDRTAGELASRNPKVIGRDALAAEAVAVMERLSITSLLITDADGRPSGVIHLHDLLKAGVV